MNDELYILKYIQRNYELKIGTYDLVCYDKINKNELSFQKFNLTINNVFGFNKTYEICEKWFEKEKSLICNKIDVLLNEVYVELGKTNWVFKRKNGKKFSFKDLEVELSKDFNVNFLRMYYEKWCISVIEKESSYIMDNIKF